MLVPLSAEWWPEPIEQPADRTTLQQYDVDEQVLARWRETRSVVHGRPESATTRSAASLDAK